MTEGNQTREYICEVCDKKETLTEEDAFNQGWDYPPFIGTWGVLSPRTCGDCGIEQTVWWALATNQVTPNDLTEKQKKFIERVNAEAGN